MTAGITDDLEVVNALWRYPPECARWVAQESETSACPDPHQPVAGGWSRRHFVGEWSRRHFAGE